MSVSAIASADQLYDHRELPVTTSVSGSCTTGPVSAWAWIMLSYPAGSTAPDTGDFSGGSSTLQVAEFTADLPGAYVLQLMTTVSGVISNPNGDRENAQTVVEVKTEHVELRVPGRYQYLYDLSLNASLYQLESY